MTADGVELEVGDRTVRISNPGRVYFPARGETKLDLVRYYLSVGDGIVRALRERPCMLHRFPSGVAGDKVRRRGWRRSGCTSPATAGTPTSCA
jgi:DNA primase